MNKLIKYLNQPLFIASQRRKIVLIATLIVLFVLGAFQPFGLSSLDTYGFVVALGLSLCGTITGLFVTLYLFPWLFKSYYANWTVGKNMIGNILIVFFIGLFNGFSQLIYFYISNGRIPENWFGILSGLFIATLLVSPIPVAVSAIMVQNQNLKANLYEAQGLNIQLAARTVRPDQQKESSSLVLSGTTKDSVELQPTELLCLEACGNYVKVNYRQEGTVRQKLLRTTIRQVEDALQEYPSIVRCHRAFLVNITHVVSVKGNSQGYKLSFPGLADEVPVSRAYTREVKSRLEQM